MRTLVCAPTYQEATNIEVFLRALRSAAPDVDVLVIDDGSPDGTADLAEQIATELGRIQVLRRPGKLGLGAAYRAGFAIGLALDYDVLVQVDADLSHPLAVLPELLAQIEAGADLVIGSRYVPGGSTPHWPARRKALSRYGNRYEGFMLRCDVRDITAGFRAYRASLLREIDALETRLNGYTFQTEMTRRTVAAGATIVEVPIEFTDRVRGTSKMSWRIVVEALVWVTIWGITDRLRPRRPPRRRTR